MATSGRPSGQRYYFLQELRTQNFDLIRFASYRTVCKLRFIQKKTYCEYTFYISYSKNKIFRRITPSVVILFQYIRLIFGMLSNRSVKMGWIPWNINLKSILPDLKLSSQICTTIWTRDYHPSSRFLLSLCRPCYWIGCWQLMER